MFNLRLCTNEKCQMLSLSSICSTCASSTVKQLPEEALLHLQTRINKLAEAAIGTAENVYKLAKLDKLRHGEGA